MNLELSNIISACITLHKAEEEVSKKFFLTRKKYRKEIEENRNLIKEKIKSLENDEWTIQYLHDIEESIFLYFDYIKHYMEHYFSIPSYDTNTITDPKKFYDIYFYDNQKENVKDRMIILEIITDNITFTIFDNITGNSFSTSSKYAVQNSQKKIESVCKHCIINCLLEFLG